MAFKYSILWASLAFGLRQTAICAMFPDNILITDLSPFDSKICRRVGNLNDYEATWIGNVGSPPFQLCTSMWNFCVDGQALPPEALRTKISVDVSQVMSASRHSKVARGNYVCTDPLVLAQRARINTLALYQDCRRSTAREHVEAGGLMSMAQISQTYSVAR